MCKLNVSEGVFCALAQCVEEVGALVSASSEGEVAICKGSLPVRAGEEEGKHKPARGTNWAIGWVTIHTYVHSVHAYSGACTAFMHHTD